MLSRRILPLTTLLIASAAAAQNLPQPAPQPSATARPTARPQANPSVDPPLIIEAPPSSEEPIIIGEPVRRQATPAPTPQKAVVRHASVSGVDITGLPDGAAVRKLQQNLEPKLKSPVRIIVGEYQYTFERAELGATLQYWPLMRSARAHGAVPVRFQVDDAKAMTVLRELDTQVREDFEKTGLNVGGTLARLKAALEASPPRDSIQSVTMRVETPEPTPAPEPAKTDDRAPSQAYPYLLAEFSTRYDASLRGRTTNLRMAAKHISGSVVQPGEVFSTNAAIGPRDASNGWKEAKMFVSGQVVSGTGAGICQAASTLYNAALMADLRVVERHPHSMRVMYVPPSRDAALLWGVKDFKFRNTTDGPLMVQTFVSGGKFHSRLWGAKPKTSGPVSIVSRVISHDGGTRSEAFKVVDGKRTKLSRDYYMPHP